MNFDGDSMFLRNVDILHHNVEQHRRLYRRESHMCHMHIGQE
jgi:hypothetical protein